MEKAKRLVWGFFIISIVVIAILYGIYLYKAQNNNNSELLNENILFYRFDCPHCKIVQEFVDTNNVTSKISYSHLDISKPVNQNLILRVAKECKISENNLGVPLYYDSKEGKCYMGDVLIIDYFKLKLNISEANLTSS